ncbi:acetate/propionate family kinase [Nocardioides sp.]|uniref:acetate/propionate family kinase n=1 Tax=Nocardioides sp. TaxID=35761 RepID=UPI003527BC67
MTHAGGPTGSVLALNCGSSTLKAALVDLPSGTRRVTVLVESRGSGPARLAVHRGAEATEDTIDAGDHAAMVAAVVGVLTVGERRDLLAVAHRLVHGGAQVRDHAVVDDAVRDALEDAAGLAPLHVPAALRALDAARAALPDVPHVATLDTAYHRELPEVAFRYAVPEAWYADLGVRRYGFHGLSHQSVADQVAGRLGRPLASLRLVTLHLGNGCSAAAVRDGVSVDTTMGFTPLEGLVMGTRSGDIDAGALAYVAGRTGAGVAELVEVLNHESGLLGLSGLSHDVRELTEAEAEGSLPAALALDVYCYRAAKAVAALVVPLGGLDALVLTGGVGEHSARVRSGVVGLLTHLGLTLDDELNAVHGLAVGGVPGRISPPGNPSVWAIPTDEELVMARAAALLVG